MTTPAHTPAPWNWHDSSGRKNGKGEPIGIGRSITGDEPPLGSLSRFSFAVSDNAGFCVAHCTNALVTMSTATSEANARLIAAAPELLAALELVAEISDWKMNELSHAQLMHLVRDCRNEAKAATAKALSTEH